MNNDLLLSVALPLAVWRLSKMITEEEGPFSLFATIRGRISQKSWIGRGLWCLWCVSFWIGLAFGLAFLWPNVAEGVVVGLALSSGAIFFDVLLLRLTSMKR